MIITSRTLSELQVPAVGRKYHTSSDTQGLTVEIRACGSIRFLDVHRIGQGKKARIVLGEYPKCTIEQAIELCEARRAKQRNKLPSPTSRARGKPSVQEGPLQELIEAYASFHFPSLSESSRRLYTAMLEKLLEKHSSIEQITMRSLRNQMDSIGRRTPVQANRFASVVSSFMQYCFERGFSDNNPARGLRRFKETPSSRKLSESQLKLFAEALDASWCHDDIKLWVRVALSTGCRGKEVSGMDWSELEGSTWTLPGSRTKNGREHLVYLPDSLVAAIEQSRTHRTGKVLNATSEGARQALKRIAVEANLPHFSNHDLRRTASTLLAIEGISGDIRSRILNHSIGGITERNYTCYDFKEEKLEAYQKLWAVLRRVGILV